MQEYFEIGQIVNTFGVKGFVKVKPFTDDITEFERLGKILVVKNKNIIEMKIKEVKYQKDMVLMKLEGIEDMNIAERYKGCYLKIHRKDAKELEEGEYFIADIIGSDVYTDTDQYLGKVDDIYNTGSRDIFVVKDELGKQILLPRIEDVILNIDIKTITNIQFPNSLANPLRRYFHLKQGVVLINLNIIQDMICSISNRSPSSHLFLRINNIISAIS